MIRGGRRGVRGGVRGCERGEGWWVGGGKALRGVREVGILGEIGHALHREFDSIFDRNSGS